MYVEVRRLTPNLLEDYLSFFDSSWPQCYCLHFHWDSAWDTAPEIPDRDRAAQLILDGKIQGYLAYAGGKVVGWCNTNDRENYVYLKQKRPLLYKKEEENKRIKSVVCFLVTPECRGQGVATQLLDRVCDDAERDGFDIVEAYPVNGKGDCCSHYHGPPKLLKKCGFRTHQRCKHDKIMRRYS